MESIRDRQDDIVSEFELFGEDWQEKYEHIINLGKELKCDDPALHSDDNKVKGCQSNVWLRTDERAGRLYLQGDSDALIVKGLVALVLRLYSGSTYQEILDTNPDFIERIGLGANLSATRSNGLSAMVKQIKILAYAHQYRDNSAATPPINSH